VGPSLLTLSVPDEQEGERLDHVLSALVPGRSRSQLQRLVKSGAVRVAGRVATRTSLAVRAGDAIEVDLPTPAPATPTAEAIPLDVLHEDADLIVVNKPAGMVVHPAAGHGEGTLVNALLHHAEDLTGIGDELRPGIVHRLDKGTSGLMLVARSGEAYAALVTMLGARRVERGYRTLVWGSPVSATGLIDAPIGRSGRDRTRMAVTVTGKEARTRYEVVRTYHDPVEVTELRCRLETGRTHQIRVHLASIGHRVVGDARYGGDRQSLPLDRPFLHAEELGLDHPVTGDPLWFTAALPDDLAAVLATLA
jgi:23S rRNA pseudouridine1911/1915/1917 synthase